jgi:cytochrome P450
VAATESIDRIDLADVDLMDPTLYVDGPPHELFARMRAEAPVRWNPTPDGSGFWSLTRHEDISAVSRDFKTFSSARAGVFLNPDQVLPLDVTRNLLLYKDPPDHTKYRLILQKALTPYAVAQLEPMVREEVTRTIDAVIGRGEADLVTDIAVPIPLRILARLIGVPERDIGRLYGWTQQFEAAARSPEPAGAMSTLAEMAPYLQEQIERQIAEADENSLVMMLRRAEVDGQRLDDTEILVFFGLLVFAGNDTTRNTTSAGLLALLEHPEQLAWLRQDPSLIPAAVEEILRWTSVVNWFARTATRDTEIAGQPITQGDKVVLWYTSASRDAAVFDDPQRFDVRRGSSDHKAFGGGGRHFCLGAGLARLELRVIFEEVTRRMLDLELAGEVERVVASWSNSLTHLPVRFRPVQM